MAKLIDLSHVVEEGMITYPGLPGPTVGTHLSREASRAHYGPGTEFHIGRLAMVANTGTYVDAPFHRYEEGPDLADLPLSRLANVPGLVIRAPWRQGRRIGAEHFHGRPLAGRAVLVATGWSEHWRTERYGQGHPYLTAGAAEMLRDAGAVLVGIDSLNIDDTEDGRRPVHSNLLAAGIPLVEHLTNLDRLPDEGFHFFALPVKVRGLGSFPVRACALLASE